MSSHGVGTCRTPGLGDQNINLSGRLEDFSPAFCIGEIRCDWRDFDTGFCPNLVSSFLQRCLGAGIHRHMHAFARPGNVQLHTQVRGSPLSRQARFPFSPKSIPVSLRSKLFVSKRVLRPIF